VGLEGDAERTRDSPSGIVDRFEGGEDKVGDGLAHHIIIAADRQIWARPADLRVRVTVGRVASGAEGAQHEQAMEMFRGDYRPPRWTRSVWARLVLAFSPLVVAAVIAFVLSR
jgi:hypothetical protein